MFLLQDSVILGLLHNLNNGRGGVHSLRENAKSLFQPLVAPLGQGAHLAQNTIYIFTLFCGRPVACKQFNVLLKIHVVCPVKYIGQHKNQRKQQFGISVNITGVPNCEIIHNPAHLISEDELELVAGFHTQVAVVNVITRNFNGGKADLPFKARDGAVDDVSDIDFFHFLWHPLFQKQCSQLERLDSAKQIGGSLYTLSPKH